MARIAIETCSFDVPEGWRTRMMTVAAPFDNPPKKGAYPRHLVMNQSRFGPGQDFNGWVLAQIADLQKQVKGFRQNGLRPFDIDGTEGQLLDFTNLSPDGQMIRQLALFVPGGADIGILISMSDLLGPAFEKMKAEAMKLFESLSLTP